MIEISHLTKKYGSRTAVDDLNLTVEPGKIYGFLGPNGAGKSTTMNLITGYLGATEGSVKINGFDILAQPEEAKRLIGYLPEQPPLYLEMTVLEYLRFAAELKKLKKEERKTQVVRVMEQTGILEVQNRLIRSLSKGYRQRVGLAQAILGEPEVILLDEPTVGLDPKQIIEIRNLIQELGKHHTVILSSHILTEISAVCDHIFIISHGKLVASDSAAQLGNRLLGKPEINLRIKGNKEAIRVVLEGLSGIDGYRFEDGPEEKDTKNGPEGKDAKNGPEGEDPEGRQQIWQVIVQLAAAGTGAAENTETNHGDLAETEETEQKSKESEEVPNFTKEELQERLFFAFADAKLPILEMRTEEKSLEDVFLSLTQEEGGEA